MKYNSKSILFFLTFLMLSCRENGFEKRLIGNWAIEYVIFKNDTSFLQNFYSNVILLEKGSCYVPSRDSLQIYSIEGNRNLAVHSDTYWLGISARESDFFNQSFKVDSLFIIQEKKEHYFDYLILKNDSCQIHAYKPRKEIL